MGIRVAVVAPNRDRAHFLAARVKRTEPDLDVSVVTARPEVLDGQTFDLWHVVEGIPADAEAVIVRNAAKRGATVVRHRGT